jgi:hypothetical protein
MELMPALILAQIGGFQSMSIYNLVYLSLPKDSRQSLLQEQFACIKQNENHRL